MFLLNYFSKKCHGLVVKATQRGLNMKFKSGFNIYQSHFPPGMTTYVIPNATDTGTENLYWLKSINGG